MTSDTPLSRGDIVVGVKALGLPEGEILMVHASLSSLGWVDGGVDAVIDALLDALGPDGTLLMPTHPARDGRTFDPKTIPSDMGEISETFRCRTGVLRSRHPYHPVAAVGPRAEELLRDHEHSAVPDGSETPYGRLIAFNGWVLHIGCDLDTLTLLHAVEAELNLPYLRELDMDYVDADGRVQTLHIQRCPGGHRGGVLKFDQRFRKEGAMVVGRIGRAVCRLLSASQAAKIMRREMDRDPGFALDDNPYCADCVRFRGKIKTARLSGEDFRLLVPIWPLKGNLTPVLDRIQGEGIAGVEVHTEGIEPPFGALDDMRKRLAEWGLSIVALRTHWRLSDDTAALCKIAVRMGAECVCLTAPESAVMSRPQLVAALQSLAQVASESDINLFLGNRSGSLVTTAADLASLIAEVGASHVKASYAPTEIMRSGGSPFYGGLYKGHLRGVLGHVDLQDMVASEGRIVRAGSGNCEIREMVSNLRCRSFNGLFCLWPLPGKGAEGYREAAEGFWEIMDRI